MKDDNMSAPDDGTDQDIQRLLEIVGPREQPPEAVTARVRASVMTAVQELPEQEHGYRLQRWALAAAVVLLAGLGYLFSPSGIDDIPVAEIAFASGGYTVRGAEAAGSELPAGTIVQTSKGGRLFLRLGEDGGVRMDTGTSLTLHSSTELWLHSGRLYLDPGAGGQIRVVTPYASVVHMGTLFEVGVDGDALVVAVREGAVGVQLGDALIQSHAAGGEGEELVIEETTLISRRAVPTTGGRWDWTQTSRPRFRVEGRSVHEFLQWAARESGRSLSYQTRLARQQAELRRLGGSGESDASNDEVRLLLLSHRFIELPGSPHELIVGLGNP